LWTHDGRNVGRFQDDEIYGPDGRYLGEIKGRDRLITNLSKKALRSGSFTPHASRAAYVRYTNYAGYVMYIGYEDFPRPEEL
jgi:hypothetical protein